MDINRIGQWVGILANVGVLLGFLVVAYQLQLNREGMEQASNLQSGSVASTAEAALMGDTGYAAFAKSITSPSDLSSGELVQFWTYMSIAHSNAQQSFQEYSEGRISEKAWHLGRDRFIGYFNYPMGLVWFEASKELAEGFGPDPFFDSVAERLTQVPVNSISEWFFTMQRGAESLRVASEPNT